MEDHKENLFKGASGNLFEFSRELRKRSTEAEEILWQFLRNKKHNGLKFRRKHPLKDYIADFYCHELKLVIEIDGGIHNVHQNLIYDNDRTSVLNELGLTVIRFTNNEVLNNLPEVLKKIK